MPVCGGPLPGAGLLPSDTVRSVPRTILDEEVGREGHRGREGTQLTGVRQWKGCPSRHSQATALNVFLPCRGGLAATALAWLSRKAG